MLLLPWVQLKSWNHRILWSGRDRVWILRQDHRPSEATDHSSPWLFSGNWAFLASEKISDSSVVIPFPWNFEYIRAKTTYFKFSFRIHLAAKPMNWLKQHWWWHGSRRGKNLSRKTCCLLGKYFCLLLFQKQINKSSNQKSIFFKLTHFVPLYFLINH